MHGDGVDALCVVRVRVRIVRGNHHSIVRSENSTATAVVSWRENSETFTKSTRVRSGGSRIPHMRDASSPPKSLHFRAVLGKFGRIIVWRPTLEYPWSAPAQKWEANLLLLSFFPENCPKMGGQLITLVIFPRKLHWIEQKLEGVASATWIRPFLQPANEVCEGNVFTCVCLSTGGLCPRGVSVQGVSVWRSLCPGGSLSRRVSVWGSLPRGGLCQGGSLSIGGISVQEGLCPGGLCPGVLCPGGSLSRETPPVR